MNDSQELQFGASIFERRFRVAATDQAIPANVRALVQRLADTVSDPDLFGLGNLRCFAACFCKCGNLLSQWRGYAGGVGGFALGFTRDALTKHSYVLTHDAQWSILPLAVLKPVVYGDDAGEAAADDFIRLLQDPDSQPQLMRISIDEPVGTMGFWVVLQYVLQEIAVVKHKAFSEEQEWRLFWSGDVQWPPKIRTRASGLVPYLDIAVNAVKLTAVNNPSGAEGDEFSPTVAEVVVGPGPSQPEQVVRCCAPHWAPQLAATAYHCFGSRLAGAPRPKNWTPGTPAAQWLSDPVFAARELIQGYVGLPGYAEPVTEFEYRPEAGVLVLDVVLAIPRPFCLGSCTNEDP